MSNQILRDFLLQAPQKIAEDIPQILSLNFVGSFLESSDNEGISDIDIVIIVDHLTEWIFNEIIDRFNQLSDPLQNIYNLKLHINSTFGPLKFNEEKTVVFHVMIYDCAKHIRHCRQSPFTCFDWERTRVYAKTHISQIYSVKRLMPHHFFNARRDINEYLYEFNESIISYRSYNFVDGEIKEKKYIKQMTMRDRYEFAFHIVRFVMINFLKLLKNENCTFNDHELLDQFIVLFPELDPDLSSWYWKIKKYKKENIFPQTAKDFTQVSEFIAHFLNTFKAGFFRYFPKETRTITFIRHEKTSLNTQPIFLGQKIDPPILGIENIDKQNFQDCFEILFSSPAKRAQQTAQFFSSNRVQIDPLLAEIDYGVAEGHNKTWLEKNYPLIIESWNRGEDPNFPEGESHTDVAQRVKEFIDKLLSMNIQGNVLVVTHNVWLRILLGTILKIAKSEWHKITIPHGKPFIFRYSPQGILIPDITVDDIKTVLQKIEEDAFITYQSMYDPQAKLQHSFWSNLHYKRTEWNRSNKQFCHQGTIVVPMAGEGARFKSFGFKTPKPLIRIDDEKMIIQAVNSLPVMNKIVYLVRDFMITPDLIEALQKTADRVIIKPVYTLTQGQACTCLLGMVDVALHEPLLIAPCDNGMVWSHDNFSKLIHTDVDIICWTFTQHLAITAKPHAWGYIQADAHNNALKVSVKKPITENPFYENCIIGTFWFKTAHLFQECTNELIKRNIRVNNEFYVDSVVGLAIELGIKVKIFCVDTYISWGKPEDLFEYRKWMEIEKLYKE